MGGKEDPFVLSRARTCSYPKQGRVHGQTNRNSVRASGRIIIDHLDPFMVPTWCRTCVRAEPKARPGLVGIKGPRADSDSRQVCLCCHYDIGQWMRGCI